MKVFLSSLSSLSFWLPPLIRFICILFSAGLTYFFIGPRAGLSVALAILLFIVIQQLSYLYKLDAWLKHPGSTRLPNGWGAWTPVFSSLYRLRRDDGKNQAELSEWLARFRQAMHLLPDGVVIMDTLLCLEWCNPAAEKHLGIKLEKDQNMRVTNVVRHPDFIQYISTGDYKEPCTLALRERTLIVQIIPFENRRQILVTHDVTEAKQIEMMRRDFIANASHELRTPLTVINGFLEIASTHPELDEVTRMNHLTLMTEQGQRMQHLVDDMLTLTRLESIDYPVRSEQVDIPKLLDQILREAQALSGGKHEISLHIDGPNIHGSMEELRSAFGNLVSNAVRYTPEGGKIDLRWQIVNTADQNKAGLQFIVQDNGIGISPEHISRLTERFYRVDKSRSRETKGTGLGLAIVKHVLLRHHAALNICSQPGKGSTFSAHFPMSAKLAS